MGLLNYNGKKIYYSIQGDGPILIILHGNTASSKMFDSIISEYIRYFKIVTLDFLGNGKSDRIPEMATDLWYDQALQVVELCKRNKFTNVNILGCSGGAYTALNVALEESGLVSNLFADSFGPPKSMDAISGAITLERQSALKDKGAIEFWKTMHGLDYAEVVIQDANAIERHHKYIKNFFHGDLSVVKSNIYLLGSKCDQFYPNIDQIFLDYKKVIKKCKVKVFEDGGHVVTLTNQNEVLEIIKNEIKVP
ncbi:alpha/beta hydrolase [Mollicutes bacterium LVI A0078]|nr:alpha/beta hydrolase [Mollicutes bacterium LVI A0075]WOO90411.1 alpha/beta hydrolase [Mollicutes bacterium LVI A0078]